MSGGPMSMLLMDPEVTAELKVTDDQKTKLAAIGKSMGESMRAVFTESAGDPEKMQKGMADAFAKIGKEQMEVLSPEQTKRLREIYVQDNGTGAIVDKDIQTKLDMKEAQVAKVATLQKGLASVMQELGAKLGRQEIDFGKFQELMTKNQKIMRDELGKVLTDDQKKTLKGMEGAPFKRKAPAGKE